MQRRSTTIFVIGVLTLVLGAATTFIALRGSKPASAVPRDRVAAAEAAPPDSLIIPEGKQAIAVALDPVAGTAGVAHAGSHVAVFAAVTEKGKAAADGGTTAARMIMPNLSVLRVDGGVAAISKDTAARPAGSAVFVLAVTPAEAEKLVYHASFSKLWFSVVPADQKPVGTPGVNGMNQLEPEAA